MRIKWLLPQRGQISPVALRSDPGLYGLGFKFSACYSRLTLCLGLDDFRHGLVLNLFVQML
jgi:hypothetical protein